MRVLVVAFSAVALAGCSRGCGSATPAAAADATVDASSHALAEAAADGGDAVEGVARYAEEYVYPVIEGAPPGVASTVNAALKALPLHGQSTDAPSPSRSTDLRTRRGRVHLAAGQAPRPAREERRVRYG
jgi:hypothetical protein